MFLIHLKYIKKIFTQNFIWSKKKIPKLEKKQYHILQRVNKKIKKLWCKKNTDYKSIDSSSTEKNLRSEDNYPIMHSNDKINYKCT